jgi:protein gp37
MGWSAIEWTDATWNPVTGCAKVSPGCKHCYAETFAERFRGVPGHPYEQGFDLRLWPSRLDHPRQWKTPRRIFVNSMSDLFQDGVPLDYVDRVFDVMCDVDRHVYQVLTKRPDRMAAYMARRTGGSRTFADRHPQIWLGTSVEHQDYQGRAEIAARLPVAVRFLSCEPLLGPLDVEAALGKETGINWVIVGGESGRGARPMDPAWVRSLRQQCAAAGVPFFFKQWGGTQKWKSGRLLDERTWDDVPDVLLPA